MRKRMTEAEPPSQLICSTTSRPRQHRSNAAKLCMKLVETEASFISSAQPVKVCCVALSAAYHDSTYVLMPIHLASERMKQILDLAGQFFSRPQAEKDALSIVNSDRARGARASTPSITAYDPGSSDPHLRLSEIRRECDSVQSRPP